ncbi:MAG: endonuclease III domain-containing protein, partial [Nitrospirae bacterium]
MKNNIILEIYKKLFDTYGPQHWWPGESPLEIAIGAILTQNTSWMNAEKAVYNLKRHGLLNVDGLYHIPEQRLMELIRPSGFYKRKAETIRRFIELLVRKYDSSLSNTEDVDTKTLREALLSIKGIGEETADSILLYALNRPVFVVDAYTKRILERHNMIGEKANYREVQGIFMEALPINTALFNEYHALLVKIGKTLCRVKDKRC